MDPYAASYMGYAQNPYYYADPNALAAMQAGYNPYGQMPSGPYPGVGY